MLKYVSRRAIKFPGEDPRWIVAAINTEAAENFIEGIGYRTVMTHNDQKVASRHAELLNQGKVVEIEYTTDNDGNVNGYELKVVGE